MELWSYFSLLVISIALLHVSSVQMSSMEAELYEFVPLGTFIIYNIYFSLMTVGYVLGCFCLMKIYMMAEKQLRETRDI